MKICPSASAPAQVSGAHEGKEIQGLTEWLMTAGPLAGVESCKSVVSAQLPELADQDIADIFRKLPVHAVPAAISLILCLV